MSDNIGNLISLVELVAVVGIVGVVGYVGYWLYSQFKDSFNWFKNEYLIIIPIK